MLLLLPAFALAQVPAEPEKKPPAKDQVYKWVDKDGVVHYSSQPPAEGAQPAKLPPVHTYKGGTQPNLGKYEKPSAKGNVSGGSQIEVVTPSHDETFRGGERVVPVAVLVTPQLTPDQKLIYLLDGTPASPPTTDTSYAISGVDRGTHTVSVTLVDAAGETLATSQGVTVHVKPPTAPQASPPPSPPTTPPPKPKPKPQP
ncbi:MAG: DUF4124 domain-containing protein [Nevskiaceae bacterium]